jgi:hypothetical protein
MSLTQNSISAPLTALALVNVDYRKRLEPGELLVAPDKPAEGLPAQL